MARWAGVGRLLPVLLLAIALAGAAGGVAEDDRETGAEPRYHRFALPSLPLEQALTLFAEITGAQVLYEAALVHGRFSIAVEGRFPAHVALGLLLGGSGLDYRRTVADGFTLVGGAAPAQPGPAEAGDTTAPAGALPASWHHFAPFFGRMQAGILEALCRSATTHPSRDAAIVVRLWFDPTGTIVGVELDRGSGERRHDRAVVELLRRLPLGAPPPADMPQPVIVLIGGGKDKDQCPQR